MIHQKSQLPIKLPSSLVFLAIYYIIGAIPFILFSLYVFTIPEEELTNHPENIDRSRTFLTIIKFLMGGGLLIYSFAHLISGIAMLKAKKWALWTSRILSILGAIHLNPFAIPGLIISFNKKSSSACGIVE